MDFEEVIKTRRSVRKYEEREVPLELLEKALGLACWAPNPGNAQAWKWYVVRDRSIIQKMADAVQAKADLIAGWPEAAEFGEAVQGWRKWASAFRTAPVVIGAAYGEYQGIADRVLARRGQGDPEAKQLIENRSETSARCQTISGAVGYLLLALHSVGLGACWAAGPMLARRELEEILGVPQGFELFTLVTVGFPAQTPAPGARKPLGEVVTII